MSTTLAPEQFDRLRDLTGHPTEYWLARVEASIRKAERPPTTKEADDLERQGLSRDHKMGGPPNDWVLAICAEVEQCRPTSLHDGNMWTAATVGLILSLWYLRLARVKAYDESRPLADRMPAYSRYLTHLASLVMGAVDERQDALTFPHISKRLNPFSPDATSGTFR